MNKSIDSNKQNDTAKYGYEDPDSTVEAKAQRVLHNAEMLSRMPRRSSLKRSGQPSRRSTIQFGGEAEYHLPGKLEPVKRRTSIGFDDNPQVEEFKVDEVYVEQVWYQQVEYDEIRKSNSKIIKCIDRGTDKKFCIRGLEPLMDKNAQAQRRESLNAVLKEQNSQRSLGVYDEERISEGYKFVCLESKLEAADRAETDKADVDIYLRSTRKMLRRMST